MQAMLIEGSATSTHGSFTVTLPGVGEWTMRHRQKWLMSDDIADKTRQALQLVVAEAADKREEIPWFGLVAPDVVVRKGLQRGTWIVRVRAREW